MSIVLFFFLLFFYDDGMGKELTVLYLGRNSISELLVHELTARTEMP
jgi:hypothetical protein